MPKRAVVGIALSALILVACGGDDDDSSSGANDTSAEAAAESDDSGELVLPDVSDEDDITSQILAKVFGLPPSFVSPEGRACVSAELAPLFPGGVVPDDLQLTEELSKALNDAADTCQVDFTG